MLRILKNYPIIAYSIIFSVGYFLYLGFLQTPKFKSESIISISYEENKSVINSIGMVSNLLGSGIDQSIEDLSDYLESDEAILKLDNIFPIIKIFSSKEIDFFSRYKPNSFSSINDYIEDMVIFSSDGGKTLTIETYAFNSEDAHKLNLAIILLASNYFDKRQSLSAKISLIQNLCQYEVSRDGINIGDLQEINLFDELEVPNIELFNSANDMLYTKAKNFTELCVSLEASDSFVRKIPTDTLRNINSDTLEQLINEIYVDSISIVTMSDAINVIAEPIKREKPEKKYIFLKTAIVLFFSILFFTTVKILLKLRDDFTI